MGKKGKRHVESDSDSESSSTLATTLADLAALPQQQLISKLHETIKNKDFKSFANTLAALIPEASQRQLFAQRKAEVILKSKEELENSSEEWDFQDGDIVEATKSFVCYQPDSSKKHYEGICDVSTPIEIKPGFVGRSSHLEYTYDSSGRNTGVPFVQIQWFENREAMELSQAKDGEDEENEKRISLIKLSRKEDCIFENKSVIRTNRTGRQTTAYGQLVSDEFDDREDNGRMYKSVIHTWFRDMKSCVETTNKSLTNENLKASSTTIEQKVLNGSAPLYDVINAKSQESGQTALHTAAANSMTQFCVFLLELGADARVTDLNGKSPGDLAQAGYGAWKVEEVEKRKEKREKKKPEDEESNASYNSNVMTFKFSKKLGYALKHAAEAQELACCKSSQVFSVIDIVPRKQVGRYSDSDGPGWYRWTHFKVRTEDDWELDPYNFTKNRNSPKNPAHKISEQILEAIAALDCDKLKAVTELSIFKPKFFSGWNATMDSYVTGCMAPSCFRLFEGYGPDEEGWKTLGFPGVEDGDTVLSLAIKAAKASDKVDASLIKFLKYLCELGARFHPVDKEEEESYEESPNSNKNASTPLIWKGKMNALFEQLDPDGTLDLGVVNQIFELEDTYPYTRAVKDAEKEARVVADKEESDLSGSSESECEDDEEEEEEEE